MGPSITTTSSPGSVRKAAATSAPLGRSIALALTLLPALLGCHPAPPAVTSVDLRNQPIAPQPIAPQPTASADRKKPRHATRASAAHYDFEGTWKSDDGSIWRLEDDVFYLRFPRDGGIRENFARIIEIDAEHGHFVIAYERSVEQGVDVPVPGERGYVTYVIDGDTIRKWINSSLPYQDPSDERFVRSTGDERGP